MIKDATKDLEWCDHGHQHESIVRLDTGGGSGAFLCPYHWEKEMEWRKERNKTLSEDVRFPIIPFEGK